MHSPDLSFSRSDVVYHWWEFVWQGSALHIPAYANRTSGVM